MVKNVAVVSLSAGVLGESFAKHELDIGAKRLADYELNVRFMPHALAGIEYIKNHPEDRAADLLAAFRDPEIDMILCAIGGDDTYRLAPYLFENGELETAVSGTDKIFLGFSDTTVNHMMLHKVGVKTFYGQSFLSDVCELGGEMLPYTRRYFEELIRTGTIRAVTPSDTWYEARTDFSPEQAGVPLPAHPDTGFELLQGRPRFSGKILGGCIDTLFPSAEDWKGRILLIESSEEYMPPEKYRRALEYFKTAGVFGAVSGVLVGKPMDRKYEAEYKAALTDVIADDTLPIVCNVNIGHALPRCILPFGVEAAVNVNGKKITFG